MKKTRLYNSYANLNKTLYTIRRNFIFASDELCRSSLNFRAKTLIKSLFKRSKTSLHKQTLFLIINMFSRHFQKAHWFFFIQRMQDYLERFIIHINKTHTSSTMKESFKKKLMIWTLHNGNRDRYYNTANVYKDSLTNIKKNVLAYQCHLS